MKNDEVFELIKERVESGGTASLTVTGVSMEPLLKNGVTRVELALPKKIKKYDIVLYKRKNGAIVLHRVVKVKKTGLSCRGDGELITEKGVDRAAVAAVALMAETEGKAIKLTGVRHRMYGRFRSLRRNFYRFIGRKGSPGGKI